MRNRTPHPSRAATAPRWLVVVAAWLLVSTAGGASCIKQINHRPLPPGVALPEAVALVEQQHTGVQSLKAFESQISGKFNNFPLPSLSARVAAVPGLRLRLVAQTGLTGEEVDIGSNDDHFWIWVKRNSPPGVYWARHAEFAQSNERRMFPIDPTFMMEALGLRAFQQGDQHLALQPVGGGMLRIHTVRNTAIGPMQKLTYIDEVMGWVVRQEIFTGEWRVIAASRASQHVVDPYTGAVTPRKVEMAWPEMKLNLNLTLGGVELNQLSEDGAMLWQLPDKPDSPPQPLRNMFVAPE